MNKTQQQHSADGNLVLFIFNCFGPLLRPNIILRKKHGGQK